MDNCVPGSIEDSRFLPRFQQWYIDRCRRHGVLPNRTLLSAFFRAAVRKARHQLCRLVVFLDDLKDADFLPLLDIFLEIDSSEIDEVDILHESSCNLNGERVLLLLRAIKQKLRVVDLLDLPFGKDFLGDLSQRGLTCQLLNLRSSHFRKLNMVGKFMQLRTLNLDFSTSLTSFQEDCFTCMPNLKFLSLCETRIANLWTTTSALSKLPSLMELCFQNCLLCDDTGPCLASPGGKSIDFLDHRGEPSPLEVLSDAMPGWNGLVDLQNEVSLGIKVMQDEESSSLSKPVHTSSIVPKEYIFYHPSPICYEKHYREFVIASLAGLRVLDNLPIKKVDREKANIVFSHHFERLPYRRKNKENVVSILQSRENRASCTHIQNSRRSASHISAKSQYFYSRSLSAAKVGASTWALLHPLSILGRTSGAESFRPRQFEYHPTDASLMAFGTLDGEVVVINHENENLVSYIPSLGAMSSVLGLCWLKTYPSKLISGSDNGSLKLFDIKSIPSRNEQICSRAHSVTFDEFDHLTSVHVNSTDEWFLASGYSRNVALYDISSGRQLQVFTDMHQEHINVVKFANHSPSIFATSSFDKDVKMWDLRQKPIFPCYTASSSRGNVMVCFSPDDHYLLVSAVDNEVKQLLAADGRLHLDFNIGSTGSSQNYTRSYYMNGRDYIVSGSCDENVVHICCSQTGRRLRDLSLEGKVSGTSMFVQSLRGDPFRDFHMSVLAAYIRPSSKFEIVKVNLMASNGHTKEYSDDQHSLSYSMGG
ncbi:protein DWD HYPERSENSITIVE TO UV-B 1 isoform X2 [Diospyros lotus]|uniref:protein DWD HYPERSENSITIVE TO UV-B 1 isoform X2 n=1 Tax=Diospyros lotus TaxID=55363 RepID=UPI00225B37CF|nr:protein DWD HYPERSENSITIVE TO UV-B 1 isoform X2 [Diospyros lotus]